MTSLYIPFSSKMNQAVREGRKVCTSRSKKYGDPGDLFHSEDFALYRLVDVQQWRLRAIKSELYRQEGCSSPEEFEQVWRSLHRGHFSADKGYFVHWFQRVEEGEE